MLQVQAGVGRTGKWWGHQHVSGEAVEPDIMLFAKGIASGFPFAGLATRENMFEGLATGTMGGTYGVLASHFAVFHQFHAANHLSSF